MTDDRHGPLTSHIARRLLTIDGQRMGACRNITILDSGSMRPTLRTSGIARVRHTRRLSTGDRGALVVISWPSGNMTMHRVIRVDLHGRPRSLFQMADNVSGSRGSPFAAGVVAVNNVIGLVEELRDQNGVVIYRRSNRACRLADTLAAALGRPYLYQHEKLGHTRGVKLQLVGIVRSALLWSLALVNYCTGLNREEVPWLNRNSSRRQV